MMRGITGIGAGKGPYFLIHDANVMASWAGFLSGADRLALDTHPYFAFNDGANTDPVSTTTGADAGGTWPVLACTAIGSPVNVSQTAFGVTIGGEFSNAINDCGLFVKAAGLPVTYGGDCSYWEDATLWNATTKAGVQAWAMANMDALQNWFFWTWKVTYFLQWAPSSFTNWVFRLAIRQQARFKHLFGHTSLDSNLNLCPPTLVQRLVNVLRLASPVHNLMVPIFRGKSAELAQER